LVKLQNLKILAAQYGLDTEGCCLLIGPLTGWRDR
jgi:hypothetical protein